MSGEKWEMTKGPQTRTEDIQYIHFKLSQSQSIFTSFTRTRLALLYYYI